MRKILVVIGIAGLLVLTLSVPALADTPKQPGAIGEYVSGQAAIAPGHWGIAVGTFVARMANPPDWTVRDWILWNIEGAPSFWVQPRA